MVTDLNYKTLLKAVHTFVFDVDGILTDGTLWLSENDWVRRMSVRDGWAIQFAIRQGYRMAVITGGDSPLVKDRLHRLGIKEVYLAAGKKTEVLQQYMQTHRLQPENILYMGDDIPDYHAMQMCGVKACPADAAVEILETAHYISHKKGGAGCVRDVIEQTLRLQKKWFSPEKHKG